MPEAAHTRPLQKRSPWPCSPASASARSPCGLTDAEEAGVSKGDDGGKPGKGRQRQGCVAPLGLRLAASVTPATTSDQEGARRLFAGLTPFQLTPEHIRDLAGDGEQHFIGTLRRQE
jgi:hypothetical protein